MCTLNVIQVSLLFSLAGCYISSGRDFNTCSHALEATEVRYIWNMLRNSIRSRQSVLSLLVFYTV
jgi:hypothetical protein